MGQMEHEIYYVNDRHTQGLTIRQPIRPLAARADFSSHDPFCGLADRFLVDFYA